MPAGCVYVGRPTKWGNPYRVGQRAFVACRKDEIERRWVTEPADQRQLSALGIDPRRARTFFVHGQRGIPLQAFPEGPLTIEHVLSRYRAHILESVGQERIWSELSGKDLCCFCLLDQPCHADVLLEIANKRPRRCGCGAVPPANG